MRFHDGSKRHNVDREQERDEQSSAGLYTAAVSVTMCDPPNTHGRTVDVDKVWTRPRLVSDTQLCPHGFQENIRVHSVKGCCMSTPTWPSEQPCSLSVPVRAAAVLSLAPSPSSGMADKQTGGVHVGCSWWAGLRGSLRRPSQPPWPGKVGWRAVCSIWTHSCPCSAGFFRMGLTIASLNTL